MHIDKRYHVTNGANCDFLAVELPADAPSNQKTVDTPAKLDIDLRQLAVSGVDPTWAMIVLGSI